MPEGEISDKDIETPPQTHTADEFETGAMPPASLAPTEGPPSVLSPEGQHPYLAKALTYIPPALATGAGIAASETGPGSVLAAALGGYLGKRIEQAARSGLGFDTANQGTRMEAALEGAKQGAYELGGRALGAVGGRALAKIRGVQPEVVGETIGGVKVPETMGQAYGTPGGFTQTAEHYLSRTFLGKPLQEVRAAQQAAGRQILADLSKTSDAVPGQMGANWERATQQTKIAGSKLYQAIGDADAKSVAPVAKEILEDQALPIPARTRKALASIGGDPADEIARALGYKSASQAEQKLGTATWQQIANAPVTAGVAPTAKGTIADALEARSNLRDLMVGSSDRNLKRLYGDAWAKLDDAIDAALTPEQKVAKGEADALWRRSYIQENIAKKLQRMQNVAAPGATPQIATDAFVKMVNELAHQPITRVGEQIVTKPSNLDLLFENPEDRKAMLDLATFLKTKASTLGGQAGMGEAIARVGTVLEGMRIPGQILTGATKSATHGGMMLASLSALSNVLAHPGGAKMLAEYFKSTGAGATAGAARLAANALGQSQPKKNVAELLQAPPQ